VTPSELPVVSAVFEAGADDRLFDSLLLLGPLVIGMAAVGGRSVLVEAIAIAYIGVFLGYTLYRGVRA